MWPDSEAPRASAPADSRLYAIGDVHGCRDLLERLHATICADAAAAPESRKVAVYLGDYVDRGADSAGVIELLSGEPLSPFECVYLMGNHEHFLLQFLDDPTVGPLWMMNGGAETLASYGIDAGPSTSDSRFEALREELRQRLPAAHLGFLERLALSHVEGDYVFVHAGLRPGVPLSQQCSDDLVWIREPFLNSPVDHGCVVVHGHTPVDAPEVRFNRINVDTGAVWSGRLTALVLHGDDHGFLHT